MPDPPPYGAPGWMQWYQLYGEYQRGQMLRQQVIDSDVRFALLLAAFQQAIGGVIV